MTFPTPRPPRGPSRTLMATAALAAMASAGPPTVSACKNVKFTEPTGTDDGYNTANADYLPGSACANVNKPIVGKANFQVDSKLLGAGLNFIGRDDMPAGAPMAEVLLDDKVNPTLGAKNATTPDVDPTSVAGLGTTDHPGFGTS